MSGTRSDRVRVLLVDDEPGLTELLSVAVTEAGRRPRPAADGESALRAARGCGPHAAVLDGMLPDLDGLQVPRRLRHEKPKPPFLVLTARDALECRLHGPEAGADDHVTKPFSLPRRKTDKGRTPSTIRTVRGVGCANRPAEESR